MLFHGEIEGIAAISMPVFGEGAEGIRLKA